MFWYIKTWITGDYTGDLFDFDRSPINVSACHKSTSGKRIRAGALTVRKELHNLVAVRQVRELHEYAMRMLEENVPANVSAELDKLSRIKCETYQQRNVTL